MEIISSFCRYNRVMFRCAVGVLLSLTVAFAQDRSSWQSLAVLKTGDRVAISLKAHGKTDGMFQSRTPEQIIVDSTTMRRDDVAKVSRYRKGVWSRGKTALVGAAIGGGAGLAIGLGAGGCDMHTIGPCFRGELGGVVAGLGIVFGAGIGVLIPHRRMDLIYASR